MGVDFGICIPFMSKVSKHGPASSLLIGFQRVEPCYLYRKPLLDINMQE